MAYTVNMVYTVKKGLRRLRGLMGLRRMRGCYILLDG